MTAELKECYSLLIGDLNQWRPEQLGDFSIPIRMIVGPAGEDGGESFDVIVCTPTALRNECLPTGYVLSHHRLIVEKFDGPFIVNSLRSLVASCDGESWEEVASKVGRIGMWEFEGFRA